MQYYRYVKMFAILILHTLILHSGDNIAIFPNPTHDDIKYYPEYIIIEDILLILLS